MMQNKTLPSSQSAQIIQGSIQHAHSHYENFPVASFLLPPDLRQPIALIYHFARQADDFADEGSLSVAQRLHLLGQFKDELDLLQAYIKPQTPFFATLGGMIKRRKLPLAPFYALLDAFSQDVVKTRYENYDEVLDYCQRSANPIGQLLLHLYGAATPANLHYADNVCSALQIINFLQDIALDFEKNEGKKRIYLCQDELEAFGIDETVIASYASKQSQADERWQGFMHFNLRRVSALLASGKPLGRILQGRIGLEMRMIISGGECIINKISHADGDVFNHRPTLNRWDWLMIFLKALIKR